MSILPSIISTAGQVAVFTINTFSIGFRGLKIYQTYHDPNIGSTSRWTSIALNAVSVAAQTASCSSSLEDKQIEQLTAISSVTSFGADATHAMGDENVTTMSKVLLIAKFLSTANQASGGRKDLNDFVHIAEAVSFFYENRNKIGEQIQELKNKRKITKKKCARTNTFDIQKEYQELLSDCRQKYPNKTDINIFLFARGCILYEEVETEFNQKECKAIIKGEKITNFKKVPYILKDAFQDRICGISKKPI